MKQYQPEHRHQFKILKCVKDAVNCFKSIKVIRTLASLTLWIPGCYIWKWTDCLSVNLLCLCFHSFYCCLSSFLPFRCSVHGTDVCPGCWMKTSTSSPSLNSLVMCMLLQLTSPPSSSFIFLFSAVIYSQPIGHSYPVSMFWSILDFIFKRDTAAFLLLLTGF